MLFDTKVQAIISSPFSLTRCVEILLDFAHHFELKPSNARIRLPVLTRCLCALMVATKSEDL
jgi:hypothetical protein